MNRRTALAVTTMALSGAALSAGAARVTVNSLTGLKTEVVYRRAK